jgi:cyclopropane fatty-acyl-phospholipid synthase-like methyltransferase
MTRISAEYLDGQYYQKNPSFHVEDSPWKAAQILKMLGKVGVSPTTVAEVGCGAGEILVQLSRALPQASLFGYELSPQGYALCRTRETTAVKYFNQEFGDHVGPPFDLVLCIDVFEHVEDYFAFLRHIRAHGRSFLFHIPLDMNAQMVARNIPLKVRHTAGHLHYFSKDTALAALGECGYNTRCWFYTATAIDRPSNKSRLISIPRRISFRVAPDLTARVLGGFSLMAYCDQGG